MQGMYHFRMTWRFAGSIETVWDTIHTPTEWPKWWRNCRRVEPLRDGDADGVGAVQRFTMQTRLPYRLQFAIRTTRSEPPRRLEGSVEGNLEGTVRWELEQDGAVAIVRYFWDVRPTKPWMRTLSPVLRPVFVWNHRSMMRRGGRGLSRMMGLDLVGEEYS